MANREDVVSSAPRNLALLDGIAEAFIKAVHQMYSHQTLRYQWMRYLSETETYPWDDFWKRLVDKITAKIERRRLLSLVVGVLRDAPKICVLLLTPYVTSMVGRFLRTYQGLPRYISPPGICGTTS